MEPYEIVEWFEAVWDQMPKNIPIVGSGGETFALFLPAESLRVFAMLTVGVRGGIKGVVFVFDLSQAIVADRLLVRCTDGGNTKTGALLPLTELRRQVARAQPEQRREIALEICNDAMWDLLDRLETSPLDPAKLRRIESTSQAISSRRVLSAGVPSPGRRGGGVPGAH